MYLFLKLLAGSALAAVQVAAGGNSLDLNQTACFTPIQDLNAEGSPWRCYRYESKTYGDEKVTIDHVHHTELSSWKDDDPNWLDLASEVAATVIPEYSTFLGSSIGLDIHINVFDHRLLYEEIQTQFERHLMESYWGPFGRSCYIDVAADVWNTNVTRFQYIIAHNLYHCVQDHLGLTPTGEARKKTAEWWYEGAADYFGISFSGKDQIGRYERNPPLRYHPWLPLFKQGDRTSLFLLYLSNIGWTDLDIHRWIASQKPTESWDEEEDRLSLDDKLGEIFPSFIASYLAHQVTYKDGTVVPTQEDYLNVRFLGELEGVWYKPRSAISLSATPFTIQDQWSFILLTDTTVVLNFTTGIPDIINGVVLHWRKSGDSTWHKMVHGDTIKVPGKTYGLPRRTVRCPERDVRYYFTVTKTFDDSTGSNGPHWGSSSRLEWTLPDKTQPIDPACEPPKPAVLPSDAPALIHASMTPKCKNYTSSVYVEPHNCNETVTKAGITLQDFFAWNPALDGRCHPLSAYDYCIGI